VTLEREASGRRVVAVYAVAEAEDGALVVRFAVLPRSAGIWQAPIASATPVDADDPVAIAVCAVSGRIASATRTEITLWDASRAVIRDAGSEGFECIAVIDTGMHIVNLAWHGDELAYASVREARVLRLSFTWAAPHAMPAAPPGGDSCVDVVFDATGCPNVHGAVTAPMPSLADYVESTINEAGRSAGAEAGASGRAVRRTPSVRHARHVTTG
jgi:hypothetical protein